MNGGDREIRPVGNHSRVRRKNETSVKVNDIFQGPVENAGVCHWSGHDSGGGVKADDGRTFEEQKHIAQIPSPPFGESARAA